MSAIVSEYWEEIINGIYTDVIISDSTGTIVYANNATDYWFHMAKEDLIGQSVFELERKRVFYPSITKKVLETKKKQTMIQDTKSGKKLLITGDIIYDQHKQIKYVVSYSQDVTDIEKLRAYVEEVESELQKVRNKLTILQNAQATSNPIIASSNQMKQILNTSMMVTNADISILITGETELFGYAPGAFTGAHPKGKKGLVEEAENGTLFLDEIGEMPLSLQVKLLTLIQEKKFFKIGESRPRYVNFRLIAATNVNLEKQVEEKSFREDLYYRLSVIPIYIPPLREREEDLSEMILAFKDKFNLLHKKRKEFHQQTIEHLLCYGWPGNVRELSNMVERLILTVDQSVILPEHLPDKVLMESYTNPLRKVGKSTLYEMLDELEVSILKKAMNECKSTTEMAKYLGVSQPTIVRKMQKYREFLEVKE
jgi:PAS domain S-box-containing protein